MKHSMWEKYEHPDEERYTDEMHRKKKRITNEERKIKH